MPSELGADQVSEAAPSPAVACVSVGLVGAVGWNGVVDISLDEAELPTAFTAFTVKKYVVLLVSPVTVSDVEVISDPFAGVADSPPVLVPTKML